MITPSTPITYGVLMLAAAKWGAIVGLATYAVIQLLTLISNDAFPGAVGPNNPGAVTLGCLSLLIFIFAFSASGFYTGRETRIAGLGAIAGMVTFAIYAALSAIYSVNGRLEINTNVPGGLGAAILVAGLAFLLFLTIAALIGWLGGRPGAGKLGLARAKAAHLATSSESAETVEG
ncbi:MAG: hypothetical protein ABI068_11620 [Ktedonobacterales bacterium]